MAILQNTYADDIAPGLPGQVANTETATIISRTIESAGAFGAPVVQGADDHGVTASAADADEPVGLLVRDTTLGAEVEAYRADDTAGVMTRGVMWVTAGGVVAARDPVFYNRATDRYFAAAAVGRTPILNASFDDGAAAAGDMVRVSLKNRLADA